MRIRQLYLMLKIYIEPIRLSPSHSLPRLFLSNKQHSNYSTINISWSEFYQIFQIFIDLQLFYVKIFTILRVSISRNRIDRANRPVRFSLRLLKGLRSEENEMAEQRANSFPRRKLRGVRLQLRRAAPCWLLLGMQLSVFPRYFRSGDFSVGDAHVASLPD